MHFSPAHEHWCHYCAIMDAQMQQHGVARKALPRTQIFSGIMFDFKFYTML